MCFKVHQEKIRESRKQKPIQKLSGYGWVFYQDQEFYNSRLPETFICLN